MNILVLGGNGFIGSNLVGRLVAAGHKVRVYDRNPPKSGSQLKSVDYQCGSFKDITAVSQALHGIGVVFHLISSSIPSTSNLNPADDVRDNLVDTIGLLESMRKIGVRRILFISSGGTIYGESEKDLISEEHPLNPICSYGIVKLAIEKYLTMYQTLYGFEPLILRVSNPYGPGQGKVGQQGIIGTVFSKMLENESVNIWGDGSVVRDYIYISDLVDACMLTVDSDVTGTFNIGSGQGYSINQIIQFIGELSSIKMQVNYTKIRELDVKKVVRCKLDFNA